ncbi:hypothetical protein Hanom_Chr02g00097781 [Helianthus anomalus]
MERSFEGMLGGCVGFMEKKEARVTRVLDDDEVLSCTSKYNIHLHKREFMQEVQLSLHQIVANL